MWQRTMLWLQQLLMFAASAAAAPVVLNVRPAAALLSLLLNFIHRGHDFVNTLLVLSVGLVGDALQAHLSSDAGASLLR